MTRALRLVLVGSLFVGVMALEAGAGPDSVELRASRQRFLDGADVVVTLYNTTDQRIEMFGGSIKAIRTGERVAKLTPKERFLPSGSEHSWTWTSSTEVGRFVARFRTSAGTLTDRFDRGAYFTVGFDQSDETFTIWVRERKPINALRADLGEQRDNRRIVSGIVSAAEPYNPAWSYSMGPGSIVLGEVFTEVCDASPTYVEENRSEWMGERWCPWSSYVAAEGRD